MTHISCILGCTAKEAINSLMLLNYTKKQASNLLLDALDSGTIILGKKMRFYNNDTH